MDVFRTIVVPASHVEAARELASSPGMFTTGLSSDGNPPPSHYISSGYIPSEMAEDLESAVLELELEMSDLPPHEVLNTLNLELVS